jgi:hypothetical protein
MNNRLALETDFCQKKKTVHLLFLGTHAEQNFTKP